jgi:hypothetical protein
MINESLRYCSLLLLAEATPTTIHKRVTNYCHHALSYYYFSIILDFILLNSFRNKANRLVRIP